MTQLDPAGTRITAWQGKRDRWYTTRTAALAPVSMGASERALRRQCASHEIEAVQDEHGRWLIHGECLPGGSHYPQRAWNEVAS